MNIEVFMKYFWLSIIVFSYACAGCLGIGVSAGSEYNGNLETISPEIMNSMYYGAEFHVQAEALPNVYLKPSISYFNNPALSSTAAGFGLGINIQPRLGGFPIVPSFGVEGTLLLYNSLNLPEAVQNGQLEEYIETSTPRLVGAGFAGVNLFIGRSASLSCHYRYHTLAPDQHVEMVWAGIAYYFNW
jgi:hypothetical protein